MLDFKVAVEAHAANSAVLALRILYEAFRLIGCSAGVRTMSTQSSGLQVFIIVT